MSEKEKDGDVSEGANEFDASAFTSNGLVDSVDNSTDDGISNESTDVDSDNNSSNDDSDSDDDSFNWADDVSDDSSSKEEDENKNADSDDSDDNNHFDSDDSDNETNDSNPGNGLGDDSDANEDDDTSSNAFDGSLTDEHFTAFASELGIKATSLSELKEAMLKLETENNQLKESGGTVTNEKINSLQGYLKLDNKELLQKDLEAQGFRGDKLQETLDTLQDNGMLEIEATKVRNAINGAITKEQTSITQESKNADAKRQADRDESVKELQTYLSSQTDMFGFKMAKDEESLGKVRDGHHKYITSGSFLKDITKNNESLAESAWLWRNRETLLKAARNNGLQQGRSEVLNDLGNPDTGGGGKFADPSGKGEFDPSKFGARPKKE